MMEESRSENWGGREGRKRVRLGGPGILCGRRKSQPRERWMGKLNEGPEKEKKLVYLVKK